MTKHSTSFRLSSTAREKLAALGDLYGNLTTAIEVAIDRLWLQEIFEADKPRGMTRYWPGRDWPKDAPTNSENSTDNTSTDR